MPGAAVKANFVLLIDRLQLRRRNAMPSVNDACDSEACMIIVGKHGHGQRRLHICVFSASLFICM